MLKSRFESELEFIQSLCNPEYLLFLQKSKYFEDPVFMEFLKYLTYFQKPPFRDYLTYPYSLLILDCLNNRDNLLFKSLNEENVSLLDDQMYKFWKNNK